MNDKIKEIHEEIKLKRSEKREQMRAHIMEVSLDMFLNEGYENTTMRKIALKSGYLIGSVYNIFKSKDEIFSTIMEEGLDTTLSKASELLDIKKGDMSQICFPVCLIIYMVSQSKRIANLLSVVAREPNVGKRFSEYTINWVKKNDVNNVINIESPNSKIKAIACMGAFASVIMQVAESDIPCDVPELTKTVLNMIGKVFDADTNSIDEDVERTYDIIRTNEIIICGVKI